ncbi:DUF5319 family protein [Cumulibacter manganitolerans]|uniref:DUF5319 family protein n=1 Tax=Cumulibacter manganitolerans TaxID=1884992 RepID=UPI001E3D8580|nr:DUF5319 family protein [Cumulibacter manganitolerans]
MAHHDDDREREDRIARELFAQLAPLDPFESDSDPASELDEETPEPLSDEERKLVLEDLQDLEEFQRLLEPRGVRGICMDCAGCDEMHFYAWEIMRSNLVNMLQHDQSHVHEPPFNPLPEEFVTWDYASGYADAVAEIGPRRR